MLSRFSSSPATTKPICGKLSLADMLSTAWHTRLVVRWNIGLEKVGLWSRRELATRCKNDEGARNWRGHFISLVD